MTAARTSAARPRSTGAMLAAGLLALALALAGCSGQSAFNFPDAYDNRGPVREPTGGVWLKQGVEPQQRDADIHACNRVVAAQLDRDRQIDQDRRTGEATLGTGDPARDLRRSVDDYDRDQRRARMFARCMRSKGYQRR